MRLISNFLDYYDHHFDLHGEVFRRMTNGGMNRQKMLEFLKVQGLTVPIFGWVREMVNEDTLTNDTYVVVHTDIASHRGEQNSCCRIKRRWLSTPISLWSGM
ncbi:hypothetical protein JOD82_001873 [Paenibacillus sp. 1182]|uniref:hypothetical protein n=1 Tax=Paenibacillus sp. 1182 TaxID=2806565 RepID=UPI001AE73DEC|nr:hypothetical protein [Paenibacillus sp. 1182]MBP1308853.1 hypothetical protein [Paenibacillus sp. 1182]